ncbi:hypothetical protein LX32DRAFT_172864 [Colletotrichum zoysiae]|uniref:Uncharacterized protein n=1 Tax=Colletotrichum zoysiae TaxID=1216348 RepID=A0AAD9H7U3_9PEZI|nr:hypothetical protein LX32DRAFT_172864 [Colletotrichum zoysiae]
MSSLKSLQDSVSSLPKLPQLLLKWTRSTLTLPCPALPAAHATYVRGCMYNTVALLTEMPGVLTHHLLSLIQGPTTPRTILIKRGGGVAVETKMPSSIAHSCWVLCIHYFSIFNVTKGPYHPCRAMSVLSLAMNACMHACTWGNRGEAEKKRERRVTTPPQLNSKSTVIGAPVGPERSGPPLFPLFAVPADFSTPLRLVDSAAPFGTYLPIYIYLPISLPRGGAPSWHLFQSVRGHHLLAPGTDRRRR